STSRTANAWKASAPTRASSIVARRAVVAERASATDRRPRGTLRNEAVSSNASLPEVRGRVGRCSRRSLVWRHARVSNAALHALVRLLLKAAGSVRARTVGEVDEKVIV